MKQLSEAEALHIAAAYCSMSEHCIQEVLKKIDCDSLSAEAKERIITRLIQEKFINEERYARSFVNDKLRFNKWGRIKIDYELRRKGIDSSTRQEAINEIKPQVYRDILFNLLKDKKKLTKGKDDRDIYTKLLRFAAGRGFNFGEANNCLKELFKNPGYEADDFADME